MFKNFFVQEVGGLLSIPSSGIRLQEQMAVSDDSTALHWMRGQTYRILVQKEGPQEPSFMGGALVTNWSYV